MPKAPTNSPSRSDVWKMFDQISPTYDLLNRVLSLGLDLRWRKKMARFVPTKERVILLDCATGTGDQIFALMENTHNIESAVGVDLAEKMIEKAKVKLEGKSYADKVTWQVGSGTALPFPNNSFDCVTLSFGIRNMTDPALCLAELYRVLRPRGRALILEFSLPKNRALHTLHMLYLRHFLPRIGGLISRNKQAYSYLNQTIETFPHGESFCTLLKNAGFQHAKAHPLAGGIVSLYQGDKE